MDKIIEVINKMISNSNKITRCIRSGEEYFFEYNDRYKWSIAEAGEDSSYQDYDLYLYPSTQHTLDEWSQIMRGSSDDFILYKASVYKSQEALESFQELLVKVRQKALGIDDILEDIIYNS